MIFFKKKKRLIAVSMVSKLKFRFIQKYEIRIRISMTFSFADLQIYLKCTVFIIKRSKRE